MQRGDLKNINKEKKSNKKNSHERFANLFAKSYTKFIPPLSNKTSLLLALDVLRDDIKIELLTLVTVVIEEKLIEITAKNSLETLNGKRILIDIIKRATELFFLKYYGTNFKIDTNLIERSFYAKAICENSRILLNLFVYSLFNKKAKIFKSTFAPIYNVATEKLLEVMLDNLIIEISDSIIRIVLNEFSLIPNIRQIWFRSNFLSIRNTERLKNNLAWQDRTNVYVTRPKNLYNSIYEIWVIDEEGYGIYKHKIYANRVNELLHLKNQSLFIINYIEFQDFILCRLDETLFLTSKFARILLTSVIGQSIGLIWRGIIDGLKNED